MCLRRLTASRSCQNKVAGGLRPRRGEMSRVLIRVVRTTRRENPGRKANTAQTPAKTIVRSARCDGRSGDNLSLSVSPTARGIEIRSSPEKTPPTINDSGCGDLQSVPPGRAARPIAADTTSNRTGEPQVPEMCMAASIRESRSNVGPVGSGWPQRLGVNGRGPVSRTHHHDCQRRSTAVHQGIVGRGAAVTWLDRRGGNWLRSGD